MTDKPVFKYQHGDSVKKIADYYEVTEKTVYNHLRGLGWNLRSLESETNSYVFSMLFDRKNVNKLAKEYADLLGSYGEAVKRLEEFGYSMEQFIMTTKGLKLQSKE